MYNLSYILLFVLLLVVVYMCFKNTSNYYAYIKDEVDTSHNDYTKYLIK